jgi:hypothetical protein
VVNGSGYGGAYGYGSGYGVKGASSSGNGVSGASTSGNAINGSSSSGYGVYGESSGVAAIYGYTPTSGTIAIKGESTTGVAVYGKGRGVASIVGYTSNAGTIGVKGESTSGTAVYASATTGFGVLAGSTGNHGVISYGAGGKYDFYADGAGTDFGPFTGAHDALILKTDTAPEIGDIVNVVDIFAKRNVSNFISRVELASGVNSKAAFGVVACYSTLDDYDTENEFAAIHVSGLKNLTEVEYQAVVSDYDLLAVNGLGEGQINVCDDNGNIEVGDFISTSATPGKGQLYTGSDMRVVVAKALEPVDWSAETETTKMIACIYMCS